MVTQSLRNWTTSVLRLEEADTLELTPLVVEASFRQFYRAAHEGRTWVVMHSPPERENNAQFCRLAAVFGTAGLRVPEIVDRDSTNGWFLLSDLGTRDLQATYGTAEQDAALAAAIDTLIQLQPVEDPAINPYTAQRFTDELGIFTQWFVRGLLDTAPPERLEASFQLLVDATSTQIQCCVHRDYHCRNLLYDDQGKIGVVDFQDALVGPVSYDLASLLRDCYVEFTEPQVDRWRAYYLRKTAYGLDPDQFRRDLDFCAVQRQLKAIGIFSRLHLRDGKSSHLSYIEPLRRRLATLCGAYPQTRVLGEWLHNLREPTTTALSTWRE